MSALVIDDIGLLVTGDPALGEGPLGLVRDAALVVEGERVAAIEPAGAAADERLDAGGRCVIPGFVDSHTHLVFAGDRADEFAARMAGRPYAASGIRVTTEATRAATEDQLRELARARRAEALRAGITHLEIKSGYGLEVETERRSCVVAGELTDDVTFLGAHAVPAEYEGRADDYVELVCGAMLDACRPHARWIDVFCERGAFDADQSRAVLAAGRAAGLGLRVHGNQLGFGPGRPARRGAGRGVGRPLHLPLGRRPRRARRQRDRGHLPAGDGLLDARALPGRAARDRRRRAGRDRDQLQPRLELHDLDGVLHRAGREGHAPDAPRRRCWRRRAAAPARSGATTSGGWRPGCEPTPSCSTARPTPTSSTGPGCRSWPRRWWPGGLARRPGLASSSCSSSKTSTSPGVSQVNMWIAFLIQSTSVTTAVRFHAWRMAYAQRDADLRVLHQRPRLELLEAGADGEHHPHLARLGGRLHRRQQQVAVVVSRDATGRPKADRALGHPVERLDHAPHGTAGRTAGCLLAACPARPRPAEWVRMDAQDFNEIHIKAVDVRGRLIQLDAERALSRNTELAHIPSYMADLEEEIEVTRQLYVISAVSEIAELRAELFGAQYG